jgi:hypothetical protein
MECHDQPSQIQSLYPPSSLPFATLNSPWPEQVKAIGVSNFTVEQLEGIIDATGVVPVSKIARLCMP